jgi:hypothetical protein
MPDADQLFPDGIGEVLHALRNPEPRPGVPYTHTFNLPPSEEFLADLANPVRLEPCVTPFRDKPRQLRLPGRRPT